MSRYRSDFDYYAYIRSPEWRAKADAAKARAEWRCQLCYSTGPLDAHHRTYERLGNELPSDITVLCSECHKRHHGKLPAIEVAPVVPVDVEVIRPISLPRPKIIDTPTHVDFTLIPLPMPKRRNRMGNVVLMLVLALIMLLAIGMMVDEWDLLWVLRHAKYDTVSVLGRVLTV